MNTLDDKISLSIYQAQQTAIYQATAKLFLDLVQKDSNNIVQFWDYAQTHTLEVGQAPTTPVDEIPITPLVTTEEKPTEPSGRRIGYTALKKALNKTNFSRSVALLEAHDKYGYFTVDDLIGDTNISSNAMGRKLSKLTERGIITGLTRVKGLVKDYPEVIARHPGSQKKLYVSKLGGSYFGDLDTTDKQVTIKTPHIPNKILEEILQLQLEQPSERDNMSLFPKLYTNSVVNNWVVTSNHATQLAEYLMYF